MKARNLFLLLAGATLLVAGCNKQNPFGGKYSRLPGDEVVFGVGTKSVETRTEYGDVNTVDGKKIQEIKWLQGDKIRIYSPDATRGGVAGKEHWPDYTVNPLATDPNKGTLTHVQSPGLAWKDNGNHPFYSVYPCPAADEGDNPVANGARFGFTMPAAQLSSDEMQYAFMTAAAKENAGVTGDAVELDFYPAFTAFEIELTADQEVQLVSFTLQAAAGNKALAGDFSVSYDADLAPTYACTGTDMSVSVADLGNATIDATTPFTFKVFCLPQDLKGLTIVFTYMKDGFTAPQTRRLRLNYANGDPVPFAARKIHKIKGQMQGGFNFKYLTLQGEVVEWNAEVVDAELAQQPQASQFAVEGVRNVYEIHNNSDTYKPYRQTWVLGSATATVSFKVFTPFDGRWEIVPQGDTDKFLVNGNVPETLTGRVHAQGAPVTWISFTVSSNGASDGDRIWFKTYVTSPDGQKFSLDSETQLYDLRGYHYFQINEPSL